MLRWLTDIPAHGRAPSIAIILGAIALVGLVDYGAGFWFSLQFFYLLTIVWWFSCWCCISIISNVCGRGGPS